MSALFYNHFKIETAKAIIFFGDCAKSGLIHLLAKETVESGKQALIASLKPSIYPIEGKVSVADETSLLMNLIHNEKPHVTYLARKVANDLLIPFPKKDLTILFKKLQKDDKLFIEANIDDPKSFPKISFLKESIIVCAVNFNTLRDELVKAFPEKFADTKKSSLQFVADRIRKSIKKTCPSHRSLKSNCEKICFINQVNNLFDENMVVSAAVNLKKVTQSTILFGNINNYHIRGV